MKLLRMLVLAVIMVLAGSVVVSAQDEEEPKLTFIILEDGKATENAFEGDVNAQLYVFWGTEGDVVTISMTQSSDSLLDPYLVLMGPAGEIFTADDDSGEEPLSALISVYELPVSGTYFVLATTFSGLRSGVEEGAEEAEESLSYQIEVEGANVPAETEDTDTFQYFAGQIELGNSLVLAITPQEPVFFVTFVASEGDIVSIVTADDGEGDAIDTLLYLFDPTGNRIAVNDDSEGLFAGITDFELPADGKYMIFATSWDFYQAYEADWANEGDFLITVE